MSIAVDEQRYQRREPWWTRQACTGLPDARLRGSAARQVCLDCPVMEQCQRDVLAREKGVGLTSRAGAIIGGLSRLERYDLNGRLCKECKTPRSARSPYCEPCREVKRVEARQRAHRKSRAKPST